MRWTQMNGINVCTAAHHFAFPLSQFLQQHVTICCPVIETVCSMSRLMCRKQNFTPNNFDAQHLMRQWRWKQQHSTYCWVHGMGTRVQKQSTRLQLRSRHILDRPYRLVKYIFTSLYLALNEGRKFSFIERTKKSQEGIKKFRQKSSVTELKIVCKKNLDFYKSENEKLSQTTFNLLQLFNLITLTNLLIKIRKRYLF